MPGHFTEEEKRLIRNELINKGRELFAELGLQKTTVAELTGKAGISKGSFYNFFTSKEELYYTIIQIEKGKMRERIKKVVISDKGDVREKLAEIMEIIIRTAKDNRIINRIFNTDELNIVYRKLGSEKIKQDQQLSADAFLPLVKRWQAEGELIDEDPEIILGVVRAVIFAGLHREEIGKDIFAEVMKKLIEYTARGISDQ